jgi:anti-sigma factor RsiW
MTNTRITMRDWEALSAYLDNQLKTKDRLRLESRLNHDPELRSALEELRRTRLVLRSQPPLRAPRNFTLTPEMAGVRSGVRPGASPLSGSYPVLRLASVLATIFFVLITVGELAVRTVAPAPLTVAVSRDQAVAQPFGMGGGSGGGSDVPPAPAPAAAEAPAMEAPAPTEAEAMEAFSLPEEPAPEQEGELRLMGTPAPAQKAVEVTPLAPENAPAPTAAAELAEPPAAEAAQPVENVASAEPAESEIAPAGWQSGLPLLRILQILLALLAIGAGAAALYLRRTARG